MTIAARTSGIEIRFRHAMMLSFVFACGCGDEGHAGTFGTSQGSAETTSSAVDTGGPGSSGATGESEGAESASSGTSQSEVSVTSSGGPEGPGDGTHGPRFDVAANESDDGGGTFWGCGASMPGGDVEECTNEAPSGSFEPDVQWTADGIDSYVTPLVANLTDDNGDGAIDLYDVPDVVITADPEGDGTGTIHVLDGRTGTSHFQVGPVAGWLTPAVGDIDNDGLPEIVSGDGLLGFGNTILHAYEHDGTPKWTSSAAFGGSYTATALADLDNDGDVEILAGDSLYDHLGNKLWSALGYGGIVIPVSTAADLDGDGDLEVVFGDRGYHHDGTLSYENLGISTTLGIFPQIGNFDGDDDPEIVVGSGENITMLEHDGTLKVSIVVPDAGDAGVFAGTVHDFDGDCISEFATGAGTQYTVYKQDLSVLWSVPVNDASGIACSTAFDFLGDGVSEAMYADEEWMFVFNGADGKEFLKTARRSGTAIEYPTVADIDNDGSAEIVVVSNGFGPASPSVQVIRDKEERWIQARRIWNQHTYHVTNVEEDGTIPQFEQPNWKTLNTFRTNAQILEGGGVCRPPPPEG